MQFELRTQVIEPQRKTFQNLIDRYGDRPASRYEEGSIDLQGTTNFHYRPLWNPEREIFSPDFSVLKLTDTYSYLDPRQFYYAPYVSARAEMHDAFGSTLNYLEKRDLFARMPDNWACLFQDVVLPMRHYESGGQLIASNAARFGWGTTITQCCAYSAFDRVGNAQILSRAGISFGGGSADPLHAAKSTWISDDAFQPLRKHVEEMIVEQDWGKALVSVDVTDRLIYSLLYTHLDEAALMGGAGPYSLVAQHLSGWFTDQRRWLDALYKVWAADETYGPANSAVLAEVMEQTLSTAIAALTPIGKKIDTLVDAGCGIALTAAAGSVRTSMAALGVAGKEA